MRRELEEVLASQRTMLEPEAAAAGDAVSDEQMETLFRRELQSFYDWVPNQRHIELIDVDYNRILTRSIT